MRAGRGHAKCLERLLVGCLTALVLAFGAAPLQAAVRASLDNTEIATGDTVQLTLNHEGQTNEQPDLTPLQQDFDLLSTSRSSSVQITNGSMSASVQTQLTLAPKHAGQLVVPPLLWAGERSAALTLLVTSGAGANGANGAPRPATAAPGAAKVFVETSVDQNDPFVQAAVKVTVRVFTTEQLFQASLEFPSSNDALMQQIGSDQNLKQQRNGQDYDVVERRYLLFPQRSGSLSLPGAVLAGQVAVHARTDRFGNDPFADLFGAAGGMVAGTKPIRVHGDPINLNVRPRPAESGSGSWIPARDVTLSGQWHPDTGQVHVGDPITLDLRLQAQGLTAAQLPNLATLLPLPDGLKAYPDQAKLDNSQQADTVQGTREQSIALIADRPGQFVVPALTVSWWDTKANQPREVSLPARTVTVVPAAATANAASLPAPAPAAETAAAGPGTPIDQAASAPAPPGALARGQGMWIGLSAGLGILWIGTLLAWWLSRRHKRSSGRGTPPASGALRPVLQTAASARAQFQAACRRNDAAAARRSLIAWAAVAWPDAAPSGLTALAQRIGDEKIASCLADLDRACYGGMTWNGSELSELLRELPKSAPAPGAGGGDGLAPLYH